MKDLDKAIIIIACERYLGAYPNLPGAITSARRLMAWAKLENYDILYLCDDKYPEITTKLLVDEVNDFINNNYIDRLIVYFAGHGLVRTAASQFWLLTNAYDDAIEGIHVEGFRRGLGSCNLGANCTVPAKGQLAMIGDACRNTDRAGIDFFGHPIVSRARGQHPFEYDRYYSTELGQYSFQIAAANGNAAYCLFSDILVEALSGRVPDAIDYQYHRFAPAVTNHKLGYYLEREVPRRAASYGHMHPDIITGISPDYNVYKRVPHPRVFIRPTAVDQAPGAVGIAVGFANEEDAPTRGEELSQCLDMIRSSIQGYRIDRNRGSWNGNQAILCHGFKPQQVCVPVGAKADVSCLDKETFYIVLSYRNGYPVLVRNEDTWTLVPLYPGTIPVISSHFPGDIFLYQFKTGEWDTAFSDYAMLLGGGPRRAIEAGNIADEIQAGKGALPHQSVIAAYLYEFANDYANIARTAHYMAEFAAVPIGDDAVVPFDLALLCAERIYWEADSFGTKMAYADLPGVPAFPHEPESDLTRFSSHTRPAFTSSAIAPRKRVPLCGISPVLREGWYFLGQNAECLRVSDEVRALCFGASGRSSTSFADREAQLFRKAFQYELLDLVVFHGLLKK